MTAREKEISSHMSHSVVVTSHDCLASARILSTKLQIATSVNLVFHCNDTAFLYIRPDVVTLIIDHASHNNNAFRINLTFV